MNIRGKNVGVIGLGTSGIAAANLAKSKGARVLVSEAAPKEKRLAFVRKLARGIETEFGGNTDRLLESSLIVKSPGVPNHLPVLEQARKKRIPVIGEIEFANGYNPSRHIIAITGTNGKTTTTTLVGEIISASGVKTFVGGNIGHPLAGALATVTSATRVVLEMSSYQLEDAPGFHPRIAAILNVTPDHMEHHGSMKNYTDAKARVFANQTKQDHCVLNYDDEACRALAKKCQAQVVFFSRVKKLEQGIWLDNDRLIMKYKSYAYSIPVDFKIPGNHNLENIMAAVAICIIAGVKPAVVTKAVRNFKGVEHRIEFVREVDGVRYVNDSKGTNVDSTRVALESYDAPVWLILGGRDKGSPYAPLKALIKKNVAGILLIGEAVPIIKEQLSGTARMYECGDMQGAVTFAHCHAKPGSVVLLSPACASFDQYNNYEERGRDFKKLVKLIK